MSFPWDPTDQELQKTVNEIVRAAVVYGYLRGLERGAAAAGPDREGPTTPHPSTAGPSRIQLAQQAAHEFLMKVHIEQAIRP